LLNEDWVQLQKIRTRARKTDNSFWDQRDVTWSVYEPLKSLVPDCKMRVIIAPVPQALREML
jgi:hypothetical protein